MTNREDTKTATTPRASGIGVGDRVALRRTGHVGTVAEVGTRDGQYRIGVAYDVDPARIRWVLPRQLRWADVAE